MGRDEKPEQPVPAVVVRAGEGELIPAAGVDHLFRLTGAQTSGRLSLEDFTLPEEDLAHAGREAAPGRRCRVR